MRIEFTGRQMEVGPDLRHYTEERLRKLMRLLRDRFDIHVILTAEKHRRLAEITLKFRNQSWWASRRPATRARSINGALDKLERQAVRLLARRRARKRRPKPTSVVLFNVLKSERVDHEVYRVLETERFPIKPLTVEEAIESLDGARTEPGGVSQLRDRARERRLSAGRWQPGSDRARDPEEIGDIVIGVRELTPVTVT